MILFVFVVFAIKSEILFKFNLLALNLICSIDSSPEIYATSKNAYMKNSNDNLTFYINSEKNQKLTINFNKKYEDISKIKLKIKFSKLNLTNKPNC